MSAIGDASAHGSDELYPRSNPIQLSSPEVVNLHVQTRGEIKENHQS